MQDICVFISHASEDKGTAVQLARYFETQNLRVWIDHLDILAGESIFQKVEDGLRQATHVVILVSRHIHTSSWVRDELSHTVMSQLSNSTPKVLPIALDNSPIPAILGKIRYADCRLDRMHGFAEALHWVRTTSCEYLEDSSAALKTQSFHSQTLNRHQSLADDDILPLSGLDENGFKTLATFNDDVSVLNASEAKTAIIGAFRELYKTGHLNADNATGDIFHTLLAQLFVDNSEFTEDGIKVAENIIVEALVTNSFRRLPHTTRAAYEARPDLVERTVKVFLKDNRLFGKREITRFKSDHSSSRGLFGDEKRFLIYPQSGILLRTLLRYPERLKTHDEYLRKIAATLFIHAPSLLDIKGALGPAGLNQLQRHGMLPELIKLRIESHEPIDLASLEKTQCDDYTYRHNGPSLYSLLLDAHRWASDPTVHLEEDMERALITCILLNPITEDFVPPALRDAIMRIAPLQWETLFTALQSDKREIVCDHFDEHLYHRSAIPTTYCYFVSSYVLRKLEGFTMNDPDDCWDRLFSSFSTSDKAQHLSNNHTRNSFIHSALLHLNPLTDRFIGNNMKAGLLSYVQTRMGRAANFLAAQRRGGNNADPSFGG